MEKKTFARVLAVLLAMCLFLTACTAAPKTDDTKDPAQENTTPVENTESNETTTDEQKPYWQMLNDVSDTSELPDWDGETLDVTVWVAGGSDAVLGTIPETNVTFKELERVTGIKFNVDESYGNGGEGVDAKLAKIVASKDYPTLVYAWGADAQLRELFDHDYLVDLTDYYDNGDLWGVEYWMPRANAKDTLYSGMCTEDGRYYLIPTSFDAAVLYDNSDYVVKEFDPEYFDRYGVTPTYAGGFGSTQMVWVRDDILTALYPDALTLDEIQEIYLENGTFTEEQIFDTGLETTEDFYAFLRAIQGELANGEYVGLDGKPMEVTYGPNSETDNWDLLNMLPAAVLGQGANTNYFTTFIKDDDPSTPLYKNAYEDATFVEFARNINALVNEDVISANSFIDNSATFKEKVANAHYAVVYGNSARSSLPQESEYETIHHRDMHAAKVGCAGKPEMYFFPAQCNNHGGEFPFTFFGFNPETTKAEVKSSLENFTKGDNKLLDLSRAYKLTLDTGWDVPPGVLHAPGSLCTYEPQFASDVYAMYQSVLYGGQCVSEDLLWKNCPEDEKGNFDYLMDVIDWNANVDPDFHKKHFMMPRVIWQNDQGCEEWICYKCMLACAKRLTVNPGQSVLVKDQAAYGIILLQGHGTMGKWNIETPTLIHYGELTHDEFFITENAAKKGVMIINTSETEPIVMLKHFAENPELVIE